MDCSQWNGLDIHRDAGSVLDESDGNNFRVVVCHGMITYSTLPN